MTHILANRRGMLRATVGLAAASLVSNLSPALAAEIGKVAGRSEKALKAAFSNIGLQVSWCAQGKQTAEYWGKLFFRCQAAYRNRTYGEPEMGLRRHRTVQHRHVGRAGQEDDGPAISRASSKNIQKLKC
jgi:hypothetical protein